MKVSREIELLIKRADNAVWNFKQVTMGVNSKQGKAYLLKKPFFEMLKQRLKDYSTNTCS